ncbi:MAG: hypothetical protein KU37_06765 [Sulfuricurvum sp. PC08-66]|nr:MAG: hypothetical protein KU37_06765 [Sulfuricurvum sp. PC08-66]
MLANLLHSGFSLPHDARSRYILLNTLLAVGLVYNLVYALFSHIDTTLLGQTARLYATAGAHGLLLWMLRQKRSYFLLIGHLALGVNFVSLAFMALTLWEDPQALVWFYALILVAFFLLGLRAGAVWSALVLLFFGFLHLYEGTAFYGHNATYMSSALLISFIASIIAKHLDNDAKQLTHMNQELAQSLARVKHLAQQNKDFIADTVHQIRTPLSVIMTNTELIEMVIHEPKARPFIEQIHAAIHFLNNSYEDLSYTISHDQTNYQPTPLDIAQLLEERIVFFTSIAQSENKRLTLKRVQTCRVMMNAIEAERLIDNNLSNAIKYAYEHSTIEVTLQNSQLCVTSHGPHIADTQAIFRRFYREQEAQRGLGLGLDIVQGIAQKYAIDIRVGSQNGSNTFCYTFQVLA